MSDQQTTSPSAVLAGINQMEQSGGSGLGYHNRALSSAAGPFGITDSTWACLMQSHPELGLTTQNRFTDYGANVRAAQALASDNQQALRRAGVANPSDPLALTAANFLGAPAASAVLNADPSTPIDATLAAAVGRTKAQQFMDANPTILTPGRPTGEVLSDIRARSGGAGGSGGVGGAPAFNLGAPPPGAPGGPSMPNIQPTPLPPMPAGYGAPPASGPGSANQQAPQIPGGANTPQGGNDLLMAVGMGLMGGTSLPQGMQLASQNVRALQERQAEAARTNAQLQNANLDREQQAPLVSAQARAALTQSWRNANPQVVSPMEAATFNQANARLAADNYVKMADVQQQAANTAAIRQLYLERSKSNTPYVETDDSGATVKRYLTQQIDNSGKITMVDSGTGQPVDTTSIPSANLMSAQEWRSQPQDLVAQRKANVAAVNKLAQDDEAAQTQDQRYNEALAALNNKDANVTPGIMGNLTRGLANTLGVDLTGKNLSDTQLTNATLMNDMLGQFKNNGGGGIRVTDALRNFIMDTNGHLGQDPDTIRKFTSLLQQNNAINSQVNQAWQALPPDKQADIKRNGSVDQWRAQTQRQLIQQEQARQAAQALPQQQPAAATPSVNGMPSVVQPGQAPSLQVAPNARRPLSSY